MGGAGAGGAAAAAAFARSIAAAAAALGFADFASAAGDDEAAAAHLRFEDGDAPASAARAVFLIARPPRLRCGSSVAARSSPSAWDSMILIRCATIAPAQSRRRSGQARSLHLPYENGFCGLIERKPFVRQKPTPRQQAVEENGAPDRRASRARVAAARCRCQKGGSERLRGCVHADSWLALGSTHSAAALPHPRLCSLIGASCRCCCCTALAACRDVACGCLRCSTAATTCLPCRHLPVHRLSAETLNSS